MIGDLRNGLLTGQAPAPCHGWTSVCLSSRAGERSVLHLGTASQCAGNTCGQVGRAATGERTSKQPHSLLTATSPPRLVGEKGSKREGKEKGMKEKGRRDFCIRRRLERMSGDLPFPKAKGTVRAVAWEPGCLLGVLLCWHGEKVQLEDKASFQHHLERCTA